MGNGTSIQGLKGRDLLFKVDVTGASPTTYTALTGLRATQIKLNGNQVDISNKNSAGWQELLSDAGIRRIEMSCSGVYDGNAGGVYAYIEKAALANSKIDAEIVFANGVAFLGTWIISDYTVDGPYDNAQTYSMTVTSHGPVIRTGN